MMRKHALLALIAAIATCTLAPRPSPAQSNKDAEAFLRATYRQYDVKSSTGPDFTGRNALSVFTPSLVQLIRRDQKQSHGEVGKLDGDPICDCQDPDGLKLAALQITGSTAHTATAAVTLNFPSESSPTHLTLRLIWLPAGWRIDDIGTQDMPSLRKLLQ